VKEYSVKLFIAGESPASLLAIENVKAIFEELAPGNVEYEVIDVLSSTERAMDDGIFATPTLIVAMPLPERRLIGNFANKDQVLQQLGVE